MKRRTLILALCAVLVFGLGVVQLMAAAAPPDDGRQIDYIKEAKNNRVVTFNHSAHIGMYQCDTCHHPIEGKAVEQQACAKAGCHDVYDKKDKSEKSWYNTVHNGGEHQGCLPCHKDEAKKDKSKKKELTSCKGSKCHP